MLTDSERVVASWRARSRASLVSAMRRVLAVSPASSSSRFSIWRYSTPPNGVWSDLKMPSSHGTAASTMSATETRSMPRLGQISRAVRTASAPPNDQPVPYRRAPVRAQGRTASPSEPVGYVGPPESGLYRPVPAADAFGEDLVHGDGSGEEHGSQLVPVDLLGDRGPGAADEVGDGFEGVLRRRRAGTRSCVGGRVASSRLG
jgi:hypothetical protein